MACYCGRGRGTFEFGLGSVQDKDSAGTLTAYRSMQGLKFGTFHKIIPQIGVTSQLSIVQRRLFL